jgi:hypothetical protein
MRIGSIGQKNFNLLIQSDMQYRCTAFELDSRV